MYVRWTPVLLRTSEREIELISSSDFLNIRVLSAYPIFWVQPFSTKKSAQYIASRVFRSTANRSIKFSLINQLQEMPNKLRKKIVKLKALLAEMVNYFCFFPVATILSQFNRLKMSPYHHWIKTVDYFLHVQLVINVLNFRKLTLLKSSSVVSFR
jgi:hypothetical protein